ncbi:hypothetical protein MWH25_04585 [Natroniella acetigena]|uniref:hypothetical protein n=1 Tax=Natroniella acetigena TaxID=52004 RepID=UPI00200AC104|nr:hypothetical protein [Natroniella acetigena]MCK8827025.1 hypothetical protein [Natroniella acetigena]
MTDSINNFSPIKILDPQNQSRFRYINNEKVVKLTAFLYKNPNYLVYAGEIIYEITCVKDLYKSDILADYYQENFASNIAEEE